MKELSSDSDFQPAPRSRRPNPLSLLVLGTVVIWGSMAWIQFRIEWPTQVTSVEGAESFSLARSREWLESVFGDSAPHPAGTEENDRIRQRIVDLVSNWGFDVETQETSGMPRRWGDEKPLPLENLLFRIEGTAPDAAENTILLCAHYDSTPYGPGICDDAVGVCVLLEIARRMRELPPPRNDILFLLTDGEEYGLLGAEQFVAREENTRPIVLAINLEARGTSGRSLMFQTSRQNLWLIREMAAAMRHPAGSSLFVEVYRRLPNDTDFSTFLRSGIQGYNFAFIGNAENYHTPQDDLAHVHWPSMQHHGENAWSLVNRLAHRPLSRDPRGDAVYFDLWGRWLLWWPAEWSLPWSVALLVLAIAGSVFPWRGSVGTRLIVALRAGAILIAMMLLMFALMKGLDYLLHWNGRLAQPWPMAPTPLVLGFWLAGLAAACLLGAAVGRWINPTQALNMSVLFWCGGAILLSSYLAGASYLFLVPASVGAVSIAATALLNRQPVATSANRSIPLACLPFSLGVAILWLGLEFLLFQAFGLRDNGLLAFRVALATTAWLPMLVGQSLRSASGVAALASLASISCFVTGIWSNAA